MHHEETEYSDDNDDDSYEQNFVMMKTNFNVMPKCDIMVDEATSKPKNLKIVETSTTNLDGNDEDCDGGTNDNSEAEWDENTAGCYRSP